MASMLYPESYNTTSDDIEEWMWKCAAARPGYYRVIIHLRGKTGRITQRKVNFTREEFALIDKVVANQIYSGSKANVYRSIVFNRCVQLWDGGSDDSVVMRVVGPWAIAYYKCQHGKFEQHGLSASLWNLLVPHACACEADKYRTRLVRIRPGDKPGQHIERDGDEDVEYIPPPEAPPSDAGGAAQSDDPDRDDDKPEEGAPTASPKNALGYQQLGAEYINEHPTGGVNAEDSEIRATVEGRIIVKDCGVGVVGQTTDDSGNKQICGVLALPVSVEPNVYAQEALNAIKAIERRIEMEEMPYAGTKADELKIKRMVSASMHGGKESPFSAEKVLDKIHTMVFEDIKSGKWTDQRLSDAIEKLCREVDPQFRLKAAVKLESMPEEKAPRLLIADEDVGQVMALMTVYCMESLIKEHFPEKGIKGLSKRAAVRRIMEVCRVPRKAAKKIVSVFEGDGKAWDTKCSITIRNLVENPVIEHIGGMVDGFIHSAPGTWTKAHESVCKSAKLKLTYSKNKEYKTFIINAIRRSGHRGTSVLNWWVNFVLWHCAVFKHPEEFLDPTHRWGVDVTGTDRWMNSAFEGDDSFLVTAPRIDEGKELHKAILQFWERVGFVMKIHLRKKKALFVGYSIGLDQYGPKIDKKGRFYMIPEIDRCFSRSGVSTSPAMIQAFKAEKREDLLKLSGAAAMSRAYEFAGLSPTISAKYLNLAMENGFEWTHDLKMRTNREFDSDSSLVSEIRRLNGLCDYERDILEATGFGCSEHELAQFEDRIWAYDLFKDWEGFRASLPESWRQ